MKYFVVIAVVLALLAITQAQDEISLAEPSDPNSSSPTVFLNPRPLRPGRPGRIPFYYFVIPESKEDFNQQSDSVNTESNNGPPHREPVLLNIDVNFGKHNNIIENQAQSTTTTTMAAP